MTRLHPLLLTALALLVGCAASGGGPAGSDESGAKAALGNDTEELDTGDGQGAGSPVDEDGSRFDTGAGQDLGGGSDAAQDGDTVEGGDAAEDAPEGPEGGLWPQDLVLRDEDGDGLWRAGEQAELQVSLHNAGEASYVELPGLRLGVESELVVVPEPEVWAWSIEPGESATLSFWLVASPTIDAEATVELTVSVTSQGCGADSHPCPDPNPASLWATLQP